jgi:hypothetical protein
MLLQIYQRRDIRVTNGEELRPTVGKYVQTLV